MRGTRIIGPNCLGIISPGKAKMGGIGGPAANTRQAYTPGHIGVMSRSGGMATEIPNSLTAGGFGQSTTVSIGGDPIIGSTYAELMPDFEADPDTHAIVIYTEPGGPMDAQLAKWVKDNNSRLPIVAFTAASWTRCPACASATPAPSSKAARHRRRKLARLEEAGISAAQEIGDIPDSVRKSLNG